VTAGLLALPRPHGKKRAHPGEGVPAGRYEKCQRLCGAALKCHSRRYNLVKHGRTTRRDHNFSVISLVPGMRAYAAPANSRTSGFQRRRITRAASQRNADRSAVAPASRLPSAPDGAWCKNPGMRHPSPARNTPQSALPAARCRQPGPRTPLPASRRPAAWPSGKGHGWSSEQYAAESFIFAPTRSLERVRRENLVRPARPTELA